MTSMPDRMRPRPADEIWNYQQIDLGFNYRMTDLQAALGLSQLGRLEEFVRIRREIASTYDMALAHLPVILPWQAPSTLSSYHLYPIRIRKNLSGKTQRQVYGTLTTAGIAVNLHYIPVYRHPFYEAKGFKVGHCPEAERFHRETISLPMFPTLQEREQSLVIKSIERSLT
jgi:dTDP-4-amino-4,6-dideoxygalactose transaminase